MTILFKAKLTYSDGKMTLCLRAVDGKSKDNTIVREIEGDNLVQVRIMSFCYGQTTFKIMSGKEHKPIITFFTLLIFFISDSNMQWCHG